jgi:hypothetical protein
VIFSHLVFKKNEDNNHYLTIFISRPLILSPSEHIGRLGRADTGFASVSASELGAKLSSLQCLLIQGVGLPNTTSFSVDDPQFCRATNEQAYQWALTQAGPNTAARFRRFGQPYVFADDLPKEGGPLWLYARVEFNEVTDAAGNKVVQIVSPMQKTEIDYWAKHFPFPRPSSIPDPGCFRTSRALLLRHVIDGDSCSVLFAFRPKWTLTSPPVLFSQTVRPCADYCKLLSPARVMEWIYVDSLRLNRHI